MVSCVRLLLFPFLSEFFRSRHQTNLRSLSVFFNYLAALLKEIDCPSLALGNERYFFQFFPPVVRYQDGLCCLGFTLCGVTLSHSMLD